MRLGELFEKEMPLRLSSEALATDIAGLTSDSRDVEPGYLFAGLSGVKVDGAAYIGEAIKKGARAVLCDQNALAQFDPASTIVVTDQNPRRRLAKMAAIFYPRQPATIAAVTGTNGKTSVASFTKQIWSAAGLRAASMGTLGVSWNGSAKKLGHTTPDPITMHKTLDDLVGEGVTHLAVEASSHGLAQHRLDGVNISVAGFTNLTRDHLDYHSDVESYAYSKLRLFGELMSPASTAVLNADSPVFAEAESVCWARGLRVISIGKAGNDIRLTDQRFDADGQKLSIAYKGQETSIKLPLVGDFQAMNALMAAGMAIGSGIPASQTFCALETLEGAPGRLQKVDDHKSGAPVFVDYAHTPDALATILQALRPHTDGRLILVFGCGGDRDKGKRSQMGDIAAELADRAIVTDDNPRSEDPAEIRRQICCGAKLEEIGDRREAITSAVRALDTGDVLVVAGKGHEKGQIVGDKILPFDDVEVVGEALRRGRIQ